MRYSYPFTQPTTMKAYLRIARFDHWIKQLFVLPGAFFALPLTDASTQLRGAALVKAILLGLAATCLVASANYVINEWLDAEFDRFHPTKKHRAVVSEDLKPAFILLWYLLFVALGLGLGALAGRPVFFMEALLLVMGLLYNVKPIRLKDVPYADVLSESVNNAIRLIIGWVCVSPTLLPPSSVILGYWMGGAYLMGIKRFAEYRMIGDSQLAGQYRKSFKYYHEVSLLTSSFFYAMLSVFCMGVFMIKYRIEFLILIPFLCGLFCLYLQISYKPDSAVQKPEKLYRERGLLLYAAFIVALFVVLMYVRIPTLDAFAENRFIAFPGK